MSLFPAKRPQTILDTHVPGSATGNQEKNHDNILKMIPDFMVDILFNILRKALKQEKGSCIMLFLNDNTEGKKKIEEKVRLIIPHKNPLFVMDHMNAELSDTKSELQKTKHRVKYLEGINIKYLNLLQETEKHGTQSNS